jgi:hypothetical protein
MDGVGCTSQFNIRIQRQFFFWRSLIMGGHKKPPNQIISYRNNTDLIIECQINVEVLDVPAYPPI